MWELFAYLLSFPHIYNKKPERQHAMANQHTSPWTPERKAEFLRLFPTHSNKQLAAHFATTIRSIEKQVRQAGVRRHLLGPFSAAEQALIRLHYPLGGAMAVHPLLPDRCRKSINQYAFREGIAYDPWPASLREQLAALCAQGLTYAKMGAALGKRPGYVRYIVVALGYTVQKPVKPPKPAPAPRKAAAPKPPKPPKERVFLKPLVQERVRQLVKAGAGYERISKELGIGNSTISRIVKALGVTIDRKPTYTTHAAPAPKKLPVMQVVKEPVRFQPKPASGKKAPSKQLDGAQRTSELLRPLPATHPYQQAYLRLTRVGQPRRDLRYAHDFFAAAQQAGLLSLQQAA